MNAICGAKKRDGSPCQKPPMNGATRCRLHGGLTPKGLASPHFTTGRYSKYLPQNLLSAYEDTVNDPELLSVRQDIHLLDALIATKLPLLETGESGAYWEQAAKYIRQARIAYKTENYGTLEDALNELEALTDNRRLHYATEQEIKSDLALRNKLVDSENKTLFNKERALTAEQAMLLVSALLDSVKRNVLDTGALSAIQTDFVRLVGATSQRNLITVTADDD